MLCILVLLLSLAPAWACPSCMQVQLSLAEELESATAVAIAEPVQPGGNRYRISRVLRGRLEPGRIVVAPVSSFSTPVILTTNQSEGSPVWSGQPMSAESGRVVDFAESVLKLPSRGPGQTSRPARLAFFANYLGDREKTIADSAYAELAAAPYAQLGPIARSLGATRLRSWLQNGATSEEYRSLYYVMLSLTPTPSDGPWLKQRVLDSLRRPPTGSQLALLFAYVQVAGEPALELIGEKFLNSDISRRLTAIQSLKFLVTENPRLKAPILPLLHAQLKDLRLAGGLMRDLALWRDWSCADQVYQIMLKSENYPYVRESALRYLVSCPLPAIQAKMKKLRANPPAWISSWPPPYSQKDLP